jgi:hypothetical protein
MSLRVRLTWLVPALLFAACQIPGAAVALDDYHVATDREVTEVDVLANDYITGSEPAIEVVSGPSCGELVPSTSTVVVTKTLDCPDVITFSYRIVDEFGTSGVANVEVALPDRPDEGQDNNDGQVGEASLVSDPTSVDFGEIESDTTGRHRIFVSNVGTAPAEVFDLVTTPVTEFDVENTDCEQVIEPGADCFVDLIFTPFGEQRGSSQVHQGVLELLDENGATLASVRLFGRSLGATTTTTTGSTTTTLIPDDACVDFEDLASGASFGTGEVFITGGVDVEVSSFEFSDETVFNGGEVGVTEGYAGGTGNELFTGSTLLRFGFPSAPLEGLSVDFGAHGGNLNIEVNGDFRNFGSFDEIDRTIIGGVLVSVFYSESGSVGSLVLTGIIHEFAIGGQEFAIDNLCPLGPSPAILQEISNEPSL